jgi:hypothetical protein
VGKHSVFQVLLENIKKFILVKICMCGRNMVEALHVPFLFHYMKKLTLEDMSQESARAFDVFSFLQRHERKSYLSLRNVVKPSTSVRVSIVKNIHNNKC